MVTGFSATGRCQCGNITYQLTAAPLFTGVCHCGECQKLSAGAFSVTMVLAAEHFSVTGELKRWQRKADSGNDNVAFFCPECGNRIYHMNPDQPEIIKLKPGTLDNSDLIQPTAHVWVSQKQAWVEIPEGVEQFSQQPEW